MEQIHSSFVMEHISFHLKKSHVVLEPYLQGVIKDMHVNQIFSISSSDDENISNSALAYSVLDSTWSLVGSSSSESPSYILCCSRSTTSTSFSLDKESGSTNSSREASNSTSSDNSDWKNSALTSDSNSYSGKSLVLTLQTIHQSFLSLFLDDGYFV